MPSDVFSVNRSPPHPILEAGDIIFQELRGSFQSPDCIRWPWNFGTFDPGQPYSLVQPART